MKAGVKCPERLAIYIERAFSKCISDLEREFMREQLEKICLTSKNRGDFFIKQWELMPLPCLQRESTSYQAMNDRLIRGDQNTSLPFHSLQGRSEREQRGGSNSLQRQQSDQQNLSSKSGQDRSGLNSTNKAVVSPFTNVPNNNNNLQSGGQNESYSTPKDRRGGN